MSDAGVSYVSSGYALDTSVTFGSPNTPVAEESKLVRQASLLLQSSDSNDTSFLRFVNGDRSAPATTPEQLTTPGNASPGKMFAQSPEPRHPQVIQAANEETLTNSQLYLTSSPTGFGYEVDQGVTLPEHEGTDEIAYVSPCTSPRVVAAMDAQKKLARQQSQQAKLEREISNR